MADIDAEVLITLVQERPILWDKSLESHKSRAETAAAWRQIGAVLNPDFESLSEDSKTKYSKLLSVKWTNIRDRYVKYVKSLTEDKYTCRGFKVRSITKYMFADQLSFLQKNTDGKKAASNGPTLQSEGRETAVTETERQEPRVKQEVKTEVEECTSCTCEAQGEAVQNPGAESSSRKRKASSSGLTQLEMLYLEKLKDDRHMSFFKGILPTVQHFEDHETVQFQLGVLNLIQDIHKSRVPEEKKPQLPA